MGGGAPGAAVVLFPAGCDSREVCRRICSQRKGVLCCRLGVHCAANIPCTQPHGSRSTPIGQTRVGHLLLGNMMAGIGYSHSHKMAGT